MAVCARSELDLFQPIKFQTSIESSRYSTLYPISTLDSNSVEFVIGKSAAFIDLAQTLLHTQVRILRADGAVPEVADDFFPINNLGGSLWADCEVFFNGESVSSCNGMYSPKAYMEVMTGFGTDAKRSHLAANGYYHDSQPALLEKGGAAATDGVAIRAGLAARGGLIDLVGPVASDIFKTPQLLLNHVEVRVRLTRHAAAYVVMSPADNANNYQVKLVSCTLLVRHVVVSPTTLLALEKTLASSAARYAISRVQMRSFTIPAGNTSLVKENIWTGVIPKRLTLGMVLSTALTGSYHLNPHHYSRFGLIEINVSVNGITLLPLKISADAYMLAYYTQFLALSKTHEDAGSDITPGEFMDNFLLSFDLTPDEAAGDDVRSANMVGNLRLEMSFGAALAGAVTVQLYGEVDGMLRIDKNRSIERDFT